MSRGRAWPLHEHAGMKRAKVQQEMVFYRCEFYVILFSLWLFCFFYFVNSLFYMDWVHLITISFPCNLVYLFVWTGLAYLSSQCFRKKGYIKFAFNLWYISHPKRKQTLLALYILCLGPIIYIFLQVFYCFFSPFV